MATLSHDWSSEMSSLSSIAHSQLIHLGAISLRTEGKMNIGRWLASCHGALSAIQGARFHSGRLQGKSLSFSTPATLPFLVPFNPSRILFLCLFCIQTHFSKEKRRKQLMKDRPTFTMWVLPIWIGGLEPNSNPLLVCFLSKLRRQSLLIKHKIFCLILSSRIEFSFASKWILDFFPKEAKL